MKVSLKIAFVAFALLGASAQAQTDYNLSLNFEGPVPSGPNETYEIAVRLDGPTAPISSYSLRFFYDSTQATLTGATNNTVSSVVGPPSSDPAIAVDAILDDSVTNFDANPATDKMAVIQAADVASWDCPGNMCLLHLTTVPGYDVLRPLQMSIVDNDSSWSQNGIVAANDAAIRLNQTGGWAYINNTPVSLSAFTIE